MRETYISGFGLFFCLSRDTGLRGSWKRVDDFFFDFYCYLDLCRTGPRLSPFYALRGLFFTLSVGDEHLVIIFLVERRHDGVEGARSQPDGLGVQIKPKSTPLYDSGCEASCDEVPL